MTDFLSPGSSIAVALGCTCVPILNDIGTRVIDPETGQQSWLVDADCPLHGDIPLSLQQPNP